MANGNGIATSDMKHNGLRKRLDVLGFSQPLPLGAVPLVGAILEDLIQTTESLKQHKDQVHKLLQEKNAWDLGVEAYKCDNSKLLAQVSALNKQLIQQKDQFEAKKLESSRRLRNLEMDKRYLEEHLQQMGERFEELEGKYQDVLDPKRKSSRKPFVSTVKSGCLIPPATSSNTHHHHQPLTLCPLRCPASARRKDVEVERDRLQQDTVSLQESIDMQSQQIEVRDREIDRLSALLSTEGRPVKALADDCCYRNVKQLNDDVNHLQRENSLLKGKLLSCERAVTVHSKDGMMQADKEHVVRCGHHQKTKHPCDARLVACKDAIKSCEEVQREMRAKEKVISDLQCQLQRCRSEERNVDVMNKLSDCLADRVKLQDSYVDMLGQQQKVLREANRFGGGKANCENEPVRVQCKNAGMGDVAMSNIQREIECMRKQLADMSVFNQRQDCVRALQSELALKDCEIIKLKNKSCLSAASNLDGSNKCVSDRSWNDCTSNTEKMCRERENCLLVEELKRLSAERDHLKRRLDTEVDKFCMEREALNNTLDKLKCRLECVERDNRDLLAKQEPKNAAIMEMQSDVKHLRCQIDILRDDNDKLQCKLTLMKKEKEQKDQVLETANQQLNDMGQKLKLSTRKLDERGCEEHKLFEDINRLNAELRKCRENCSCLESQNARISADLCAKMEDAKRFQCEVEGYKQDQNRVIQEYESMKKKYSEQLQMITCLECQTREMGIEIDTYNCQITSLRKELECSTNDNKKLADQLTSVECEFSNTKRLLTDSQMRNDELQSKIKEYMLEVNRVGKLLEEKEKERDEMVENLKKLSECTCALRGKNISMGAELCQHRNDLQEAKKQICELHRLLESKEAEMNKHRDEANRSLEEVCMMRADLEKCYDTHRKLHEESRELRKARQDMIMSTERLKNELETWKTLHDEMKNRNEKLKRELKAVQCEDYPSSVKKLQEILAQNREAMDTQVNKIACLTSQLGETKEQFSKFKQSVDEERCKADPMKGYLEKGCELEKLTSRLKACCEEAIKPKQVSIVLPSTGCARKEPEIMKGACGCCLNLKSNKVVVTTPGAKIIGDGVLTMKKKCPVHQGNCPQGKREVIPIPRSRSYNANLNKQNCATTTTHRHQSCSPGRNVCLLPKSPRNLQKVNSCVPLEKMCADMNMSGLMGTPAPSPPPPPPAVSATQVAMNLQQASNKKLLDDVRRNGQAKRQWSSSDEIEQMIKSQRPTDAAGCGPVPKPTQPPPTSAQANSSSPPAAAQRPVQPQAKATESVTAKCGEAPRSAPPPTVSHNAPAKRTDIPKKTLVSSFIPKDQPRVPAGECKKVDDTSFKPPTETSALEKGFNSVVAELKSITHNIFGKADDEVAVSACSNEGSGVSDSVKQKIQRFQSIVNDTSRAAPRATNQIRPTPAPTQPAPSAPATNQESQVSRPTQGPNRPDNSRPNDESGEESEKPRQGIIRRVIDTIAQGGGIQGLSTLHREDDDTTKAMKELQKKAVEHEQSELLNYSRNDDDDDQGSRNAPTHLTPRRSDAIALPNVPIIASSAADSGSEGQVIDLTESLKGGNECSGKSSEQPSSADSEVEYIPNPDPTLIHTVSSATRQGISHRSTIADSEDRFQTMIHTEPSIMRHEEYNTFAKHKLANASLDSSDDGNDQQQQQRRSSPRKTYSNVRRRTKPSVRQDQYVNCHRGYMESTPFRELLANEAVEQDDGCVATSSASETADEDTYNGQFVNAGAGQNSPLRRDGRSIVLSPFNSPKGMSRPGFNRFVNHFRGHDSGPTLPFRSMPSGDDDYSSYGDSVGTIPNSLDIERLMSASNNNPDMNLDLLLRSLGLKGGSEKTCEPEEEDEDEDEEEEEEEDGEEERDEEEDEEEDEDDSNRYMNEARITNGSEDSMAQSNGEYGPYVRTSTDSNGTPQSFKGPYGKEFSADDNLRNLSRCFDERFGQEWTAATTTVAPRRSFGNKPSVTGGRGASAYSRGKDILMSKFVNTPEPHSQRNYLDGLQSSVDESTSDERSGCGTSTGGTTPMKYFWSVSKSMDENNSELNVNVMLVGQDDDDDCGRSVSCLSESTQNTQLTKWSISSVYLTYSEPRVTRSMLNSLMENEEYMAGGESLLTAQMDSEATTTDKGKGFLFSEEMLTSLEKILQRNQVEDMSS